MTIKNLVGRAVALTTAACLITALPAAAQGVEPTTTEPGATVTSEPSPTSTQPPSSTTTQPPSSTTTGPAGDAGDEVPDEQPDPGEGEIAERYEGLPPEIQAQIGAPTDDEVVVSDSLRYRDYEHARFYWTPEYDVKIVFGGILGKYLELGAHQEVGVPTTDETSTEDGAARYSTFVDRESGTETAIYWTADTGAHEIRGPILQHWRELGAGATLGYPTTDSNLTPDAFGVYNHFVTASGVESSIYWTKPNGAHAIKGAIRAKWAAGGWEQGPLGYPVTDELTTDDGVGRYSEFSGTEDAVIVWAPETGAHTVYGLIAQRYDDLGGPNGFLGYPTTDELPTPDGVGRFNHFTGAGGSSIYWTPRTGANEIYGGIRDRWESLGWERSYLGYPTSGEYSIKIGRRSDFEHGTITYNRGTGEVTDQPY